MLHSTLRNAMRLFGGLLLGLVCAAAYPGEEVRTLKAAYVNFPPLSYTDPQGKPAGQMIELGNRLAEESGLQLSWREYPISRIYHNLKTGQVELWPGSSGAATIREHTLETRAQPDRIRLYAYRRQTTERVGSAGDLVDARLILIRGYTYLGFLDSALNASQVEPVKAPNHVAALQLLEIGRGDYLMNFAHPMEAALREYPVDGLQRDLVTEWPITFIVSRHTAQAREIVDALDKAYDKLMENSEQE